MTLPANWTESSRLVVYVVDVGEVVAVVGELVAVANRLLTHILCIELCLMLRGLVRQLAHEIRSMGNCLVTGSDLGLKEKFWAWMAHAWPGVSRWQGGMQHIGRRFRILADASSVSNPLLGAWDRFRFVIFLSSLVDLIIQGKLSKHFSKCYTVHFSIGLSIYIKLYIYIT